MIIDDKFIFVHNPICGGAFLRKILSNSFADSKNLDLVNWHDPIKKIWPVPDKFVFGNVRNPWAWYYSYYKKSMEHGGCFYHKIGKKSFLDFTKTLLSSEFAKKNVDVAEHPIGNPYSKERCFYMRCMHNLDIGLLSYQYIYLYFKDCDDIFDSKLDVFGGYNDWISVDAILKSETLLNDLISEFTKRGIYTSKSWHHVPRENYNANIKDSLEYAAYYDDELKELVRYKERLIIKQHGYKYDRLG